MKLCTHCGRRYPDETLYYCLDDGSELIYGATVEDPTLIQGALGTPSDQKTVFLPKVSASNEQSAPKAVADLKYTVPRPVYIVAAIIAVGLAIALAARYQFRSAGTNAAADIHSIAVLPLQNLSGDPSQEYFSDGMTDALIGDLSQIRSIRVISRTSVMRFKGSRDSLPEIARALGVDAVIEGSVIRAGDRVRISAQLVPATTDSSVWSRNYEREMSDILKLQSDVAQAIAGEIRAQLTSTEQQRLTASKSINPNASEEYLLGKYQLQKHLDANLESAIDHFTKAIEIEPNYAEAWAGLSDAWFQRGIWGKYSHTDVESAARNAAQKALDIDPNLPDAHIAMVYLNMNYDFDWPSAQQHAKRAIELDPSSSAAYIAYSWYLINFSRFDELKQAMMTAEQLDPVSQNLQSDFGRMMYRARLYGDAESHLKKAIELDESSPGPYDRLADVLLETQRYDEAFSLLNKASAKGGGEAPIVRKAILYARMGQKQKALEVWNSVANKNSVNQARLSTEFGDLDNAFRELNRALDQHETVLPHIRVDPGFDKLHPDPRWETFLARMNLPPS